MNSDPRGGLKIETASGVLANDMMAKHIAQFQHVIRKDRTTAQATTAAYIEGLAVVLALTIAGRHGSYWEVMALSERRLREEVDRVLTHLRAK